MTSNEKSLANISFINKDFESLWTELLALVPKLTRKWDPSQANESDPLAVLLKLIAIAQDKANYNIDKNILELYPLSLTQQSSAFNVYDALGYTVGWYRSGSGQVLLKYVGSLEAPQGVTVPRFSQVSNNDSSLVYTIVSDDITFADKSAAEDSRIISTLVDILQGRCTDFLINGESIITSNNLDANNRLYFIEPNIAQNGVFIKSADNTTSWKKDDDWKKVSNLSQVASNTKCYQFGVDPRTSSCYIQFPDDIGSLIGAGLKIKYIVSDGESGNALSRTITQFYNNLKLSYINNEGNVDQATANDIFSVSNSNAILDGKNPDNLDTTYDDYKRTTNIVNTLVTLLDYKEYLRDYIQDNRNIVSNVQVADRTNDLYSSYAVKTLDENHQFSTETHSATGNELSAYDLRLYPLASSSDTTTKLGYDNSFQYLDNNEELVTALDTAKTINHNFQDLGYPIILTYDLAGQIYLDSRVTAQEAREIRANVLSALYQSFSAYNVDFGAEPDYKKLVDTITNADKRIQYVALQPISDYTQTSKDNDPIEQIDVIERSVLAGKTPWAVLRDKDNTTTISDAYKDTVNIAMGQDAKANIVLNNKVASYLQAGVVLTAVQGTTTTLEVGPNEHISFLTPQYKEDITYTNYLYYKVQLSNEIPANTPYILQPGEEITFYETTQDYDANNIYAKISAGTIVKSNISLETDTSNYLTLNAKNTISTLSPVEASDWEPGDSFYCSSESVYNRVMVPQTYFILQSGEYIIYLKASGDFIVYGEGTAVATSNTLDPNDFTEYRSASSTNLAYYQESGDISSLMSYFILIQYEKDKLIFGANTILTFGEGYKFIFGKSSDEPLDNFWDTKFTSKTLQTMSPEYGFYRITSADLQGTTSRNNVYYSKDGNNWTALPTVLSSQTSGATGWRFIVYLSLAVSPKSEQTFYTFWSKDSTQADGTYKQDNTYVKHVQLLGYKNLAKTLVSTYDNTTNIPTSTYTLSASKTLLSSATSIPVDEEVELYSFIIANDKAYNIRDSFVSVDGLGTLKTPNIRNVYYILPAIKRGSSSVSYYLYKPGKTIVTTNIDKISSLVAISTRDGSNLTHYYDGAANKYQTLDTLFSTAGADFVELQLNARYDELFSPAYIPSETEEILNPALFTTFFNKNHVFNRYVISKIGNTDSLIISSLSVQ